MFPGLNLFITHSSRDEHGDVMFEHGGKGHSQVVRRSSLNPSTNLISRNLTRLRDLDEVVLEDEFAHRGCVMNHDFSESLSGAPQDWH